MKSNTFTKFLVIVFILVFVALFMVSPFFRVSAVHILGNETLTDSMVLDTIRPHNINHMVAFNRRGALRSLRELSHYVESVNIERSFLSGEIFINVEERTLSGYIEYMQGRYLFIDAHGRVLEVASAFTKRLPIIVGMDYQRFALGQPLEVDNPRAFETLTTLTQIFNRYDMQTDVIRVDISNLSDIRLYIDELRVMIGSIQDIDEKINTLIAIMAEFERRDQRKQGFLYISDVNQPARFMLLQ